MYDVVQKVVCRFLKTLIKKEKPFIWLKCLQVPAFQTETKTLKIFIVLNFVTPTVLTFIAKHVCLFF